MKKIGLRIISAIMCGVMVCSLGGCGKNSKNVTDNNTSEVVSNEEIADQEKGEKNEDKMQGKPLDANLQDLYDRIVLEPEDDSEPLTDEEKKYAEQMNSYSMMYYLAITSEEIRVSKDNRLVLENIYTSLLNDPNPSAIDDKTQEHLQELRDTIRNYIDNSKKRERLQYLFNQDKSNAIKSAVPEPVAALSVVSASAVDWKALVIAIAYTAIDSVSKYSKEVDSAEKEYLVSGWQLDDEQEEAVRKNRDHAFNYMVDMVQEYHLDGKLTLSEKRIEDFVEICNIEKIPEKIKRLESEEESYHLLGNYWLELADCYFESSDYEKCLESVVRYKELSTGIYRQDVNYVSVLPKAIVSAQELYSGDEYKAIAEKLLADLMQNTSTTDWANRYFAAQVYIDLYNRTRDKDYLNKAYKITSENVTVLLKEQRELNSMYINDVEEISVEKPNYDYLNDEQKKAKQKEYQEEKKKAGSYNKKLKEIRKNELPTLSAPLVINCELLFTLAKKLNIDDKEKKNIDAILDDTFITLPIRDSYCFSAENSEYEGIELSKDSMTIPAELLSADSVISAVITENNGSETTIDDLYVKKVDRKGEDLDSFIAIITGDSFKKYKWTADSKIHINILYNDAYGKNADFEYEVTKYEKKGPFETVEFGKK